MAEFRVLLEGRVLVESPRWHDDRLVFSDWDTQEIVAVDLAGASEVVATVHAMPFCLDRTPAGELVVLAGSQLLRQASSGELAPVADLSSLARTAWNDIVVDGHGNAHVNNIGFDFPEGEFAPGLIALVRPDGSVSEVADGLAFPNGMVVSPDGSTLIVAESYGDRLTGYTIEPDGTLSQQRVWAELGEGSAPDGIGVDAEGAVWYASVPGQRCVRVREGGEVLQTVTADRGCFACTLGGHDGTTLFAVGADWNAIMEGSDARTGQVLLADVDVPAAGWPH